MASGAVGVNSANVQGRVAAAYANDTAPATTPSKKSLLEIQFVSKHICKTSLTLKTQKWRQILRGRPVRLCVLSNTSESRLIWFRYFFFKTNWIYKIYLIRNALTRLTFEICNANWRQSRRLKKSISNWQASKV